MKLNRETRLWAKEARMGLSAPIVMLAAEVAVGLWQDRKSREAQRKADRKVSAASKQKLELDLTVKNRNPFDPETW